MARKRSPRWKRRASLTAAVLIGVAGLAGCADPHDGEPTAPSASRTASQATSRGGPIERFPEMLDVIPAVRIAESGAAQRPEPSDEELVEAVTRAGGRVLIGLKPATAQRTRETGVVPAITRAEALGARAAIQALGAEITMSYRFTGAVAATIPPHVAPALRRLGVVDHVEPSFPGRVAQTTGQQTSWGVTKIRAPWVWDQIGAQSTRGELSNVTIIDTGLDSTHVFSSAGDGPANTYGGCAWVPTDSITHCYDDLTNDNLRGHGPAVAGVVAARNNAVGYVGIAHDPAQLMSIRVCDNSGCPPENVLGALNWALGSGLSRHVVSISIGYCTNYTDIEQVVA